MAKVNNFSRNYQTLVILQKRNPEVAYEDIFKNSNAPNFLPSTGLFITFRTLRNNPVVLLNHLIVSHTSGHKE